MREGQLSSLMDYRRLKSALRADLTDADLCDLSQDAFEQAIRASNIIPCGRSMLFMWGALSYTDPTFSSPRNVIKSRQLAFKGLQ